MNQKIRIKLKSYDFNFIDNQLRKIVKTVKSAGAVVSTNSIANSQKNLCCVKITARKKKLEST